MGYPSRNQMCLDFGPEDFMQTEPRPPYLELSGIHIGRWAVQQPGRPPIYRDSANQADAMFGWLVALWRGQSYFEERNCDLYDRRTGKRLRHGYRELFYQINDGHQLRATLRFLEDSPEGHRFVFFTDEGAAICRQCVRQELHDLTFSMRHPELYGLRVVGTELRYTEPLSCDCCYGEIPPTEGQL